MGPVLAHVRDEVLTGRGFALLRGLSLDGASPREIATAFFGIGSHLGNARAQNAAGHVLGHVADLGLSSRDPNVRIYQTRERQTYHTDSCDVVGLLCVRKARAGGLSALVSSTTIFNEMRGRRPDLLVHLFEPIATDRRGEVPSGMDPWFEIPVFSWYEGHLTAIYQRQYIDSAQRFPGAPRLTDGQREALDLFDRLTNDPALHFHMELEPGDVQLVHNHTILHDRTAFEDWEERGRRRHLLRLWLSCRDARPAPRWWRRWNRCELGRRAGRRVGRPRHRGAARARGQRHGLPRAPMMAMQNHLHVRPPPVSSCAPVPTEVDRVIERALAKAPEQRFADARSFLAAFRAAAFVPRARVGWPDQRALGIHPRGYQRQQPPLRRAVPGSARAARRARRRARPGRRDRGPRRASRGPRARASACTPIRPTGSRTGCPPRGARTKQRAEREDEGQSQGGRG